MLSALGVTGIFKTKYWQYRMYGLTCLIFICLVILSVDKMMHMVGSYPPKTEIQSYTTPTEDAPAGVMARGSYSVSSLFTDDDKHEHLKWEWSFEIKKDWKE